MQLFIVWCSAVVSDSNFLSPYPGFSLSYISRFNSEDFNLSYLYWQNLTKILGHSQTIDASSEVSWSG
jgi:hypothetical protein